MKRPHPSPDDSIESENSEASKPGKSEYAKTGKSDQFPKRDIKLNSVVALKEKISEVGHPALRDLVRLKLFLSIFYYNPIHELHW
jgi:hypothetical protein